MTSEDLSTIEAIRTYGGSFMKHLGMAYAVADAVNQRKIRETWAREWAQYEIQGRMLREREQAASLREGGAGGGEP